MKAIWVIGVILGSLIFLGWLGTQFQPQPFPPFETQDRTMQTVPLPEDLPEPVERYYRKVYGNRLPVIPSAVISGRGTMRINGITLPVRWRFSHQTGQNYRHYIETTWFGVPFLRVNEWYISGSGRLELPFGISEGSQVDQGANLGLWAETLWASPVWLTDPRVSWDEIDEHTAALTVPFEDQTQTFIVRFDPETDLVQFMESMRYQGEGSLEKTLWINQAREWNTLDGDLHPVDVALIWFDEGTPWAQLQVEEVVYHADLSEYINQEGP